MACIWKASKKLLKPYMHTKHEESVVHRAEVLAPLMSNLSWRLTLESLLLRADCL